MKEERDSRHLMWSIGDKPIVAARYQLQLLETGDVACIMDRFAHMPGYIEREGLAQKCIEAWIDDAKQVSSLLLHEQQSRFPSTQGAPGSQKFCVHIPEALAGVVSILQRAGFVATGLPCEGILQLVEGHR